MNTFRTVAIFISCILAMTLLIFVMLYQMFMIATYDPEMEVKMPIIEERAEQRKEAIRNLQEEAMCEDTRFNIDCD